MFQDLPPVKFEVRAVLAKLRRRDSAQRSEMTHVASRLLGARAGRWPWCALRLLPRRSCAPSPPRSHRSWARRPAARSGRLLRVALPDGFHIQSNKPRDPALIPTELTIDAPPETAVREMVFPKPIETKVLGFDEPLAVFEREFVDRRAALRREPAGGRHAIPAHLRYQACNDTTCFPPKTVNAEWTTRLPRPAAMPRPSSGRFRSERASHTAGLRARAAHAPGRPSRSRPAPTTVAALNAFTVLGTTGGYLGASDFLRFIHNAETGVKERGMFEGRGPLAILLLVLIGGLALNLTPCVLPMIPINLAIIGAGAQAGSRGRGFVLGSAYGAAMALVYGVLGLVVILTAGTFGTINASPWFNLGIAVLFVVLVWRCSTSSTIDFSRYSSGIDIGERAAARSSLAFSMGAVAALLAGACVAPVVIQVVLFSSNLYATGTKLALALPFCLGIGMAIPWPIAGAGLAALPKPGMWMVRVKQAFGVVHPGRRPRTTATRRTRCSRTAGSIRRRSQASVSEQLKAGWHPSLADGLDDGAARAEAGADRHVGDVVQELPDDGQDDARERGRADSAGGLRQDQVPGGRSRRAARQDVMQRFGASASPPTRSCGRSRR